MVSKDGFTDVVPRFHNIGNDSDFALDYFMKLISARIDFKNKLAAYRRKLFRKFIGRGNSAMVPVRGCVFN